MPRTPQHPARPAGLIPYSHSPGALHDIRTISPSPAGRRDRHGREVESTRIRLLRSAGFRIEALHELYPPDDAPTHEYYDIVTADWARSWPAEDLWVAVRDDA